MCPVHNHPARPCRTQALAYLSHEITPYLHVQFEHTTWALCPRHSAPPYSRCIHSTTQSVLAHQNDTARVGPIRAHCAQLGQSRPPIGMGQPFPILPIHNHLATLHPHPPSNRTMADPFAPGLTMIPTWRLWLPYVHTRFILELYLFFFCVTCSPVELVTTV